MDKGRKTNADSLREMDNKALAAFLGEMSYNCAEGKCCDCPVSGFIDFDICGGCDSEKIEEWLQEVSCL